MPRGSTFPLEESCRPGSATRQCPRSGAWIVLTPEQQRNRGGKSFSLVGRLRSGVSLQAAEADLAVIAADIARQFPASNAGWTVRVIPLHEQLVGSVRTPLVVLLTAVGLVLLIACANVANLLLVRAASRQREFAVRYALGAERWQILRQLLVESLMLSLAAGAVGILIGWWALQGLLAMLPAGTPAVSNAALDGRVIVFTAAMSILTGLVFGIVPAVQTARVDLIDGLREGARGSTGSRRAHRTRNMLVVVEVALASMLLILASLLIQTFVRLLEREHRLSARRRADDGGGVAANGVSGAASGRVLRAAGDEAVGGARRRNGRGDLERAAGGDREPAPGDRRGTSPP